MGGLWPDKYLVTRRDGTVPSWLWAVFSSADPAAPAALRAYADEAERLGMDPDYVSGFRARASEFEQWREIHGAGDPDAPPHRTDDPEVVARMASAREA